MMFALDNEKIDKKIKDEIVKIQEELQAKDKDMNRLMNILELTATEHIGSYNN